MADTNRRRWAGNGQNERGVGRRRLRLELLEQRLALTWAGVPPTSIALPASPVDVTLNAQNDATGAASIATTEIDYYAFTARSSGSYTISATTPSSSLDTVLGIFSATGQRLTYNDDIAYPSNTDSRVSINLTAGTRYYIGITNYASSSRGAYTWTIDGPAPTTTPTDDAYENNDTLATAFNLGTLTSNRTVSALVMADVADWYRFTTSATGTTSSSVSIAFTNSQGNLQLALYNSAGTLLSTSAGSGNNETISLNGLAAGTYYVDVYGAAGATNPNYTLTVAPPTTVTNVGGFQITLSMTGLTVSQQSIFQQAAARWSQVITGDLPNATYRGQTVDDLLINASSTPIDGVNGILGQAGPDAFRSGSLLPYHGIMEFDSADMASMERSGLLYSVVLHEIGHILGIGTIWEDRGLLTGAGTNNPIFVGANATAQYNQIFGTSARGVPVENTGGPGTADGHWRDSILSNELMTGYAGPGTNLPLSRITIGSLADIGYTVNYAAADSYTPSTTSLAAARQAAGAATAAVRLRGLNSALNTDFIDELSMSIRPLASAEHPRRGQSVYRDQYPSRNARFADLAFGDATSTDVVNSTTGDERWVDTHDTASTIDQAWDELTAEWNNWPALAIA